MQQLIDVRNQLDKYASPSTVDWHFSCINNRWTKRALVSAGFGYPSPSSSSSHRWKPIFSVAEIGGESSAAQAAEYTANEKELEETRTREARRPKQVGGEIQRDSDSGASSSGDFKHGGVLKTRGRAAVVSGLNRPLFHIDLTSALQSAIANVQAKSEFEGRGGEGIGEVP